MPTYKSIASTTVGSGGTLAIEFNNIPQTYTDLLIRISGRTNTTNETRAYTRWRFNDSAAGYGYVWLFGYDNSVSSYGVDSNLSSAHILIVNGPNSTGSTFGNSDMYIFNYTNSTNNKTFIIDGVTEHNSSSTFMLSHCAAYWTNTSAINKIVMQPDPFGGGTLRWQEFTTATLYGISNA